MGAIEWARKEIAIAKAAERRKSADESGSWRYGEACYDSALKAYECIMSDGHSGMSYGITVDILKKLLDEKPLTPILDLDDIWGEVGIPSSRPDVEKAYDCIRHYSLHKYVLTDGSVQYYDWDRFLCLDMMNPSSTFSNGFVSKIAHQYLPIEFPYIPERFIVRVNQFLFDPKNGDFDTMYISTINTKNGDLMSLIQRSFKEEDDGWVEIDGAEYISRKVNRVDLKKEEV